MNITWEDRKGRGQIDGVIITEKPDLSFDYAWFKVGDGFGQYVESHDYGHWNKDLTLDQIQEIVDYYDIQTAEKPAPSNDLKVVVMTGTTRDENGKLCPVWGEEDKFSDIPGGQTKAEQESGFWAQKLNDVRAEKQTEIDTLFKTQMAELKGGTTPDEVDTFMIQEREARAYIEDDTVGIPFIATLATARGITVAELIPKIIAKADLYTSTTATIMGNKHRLEDLLYCASDIEAVAAIIVE